MKLTKKKEPESDLERRLDEIGVTIECWCGGRGEDPAYERREKPWRHFVWLCPERPSIYFAAQESGRKVRDLLGRKLCEELGSVEH